MASEGIRSDSLMQINSILLLALSHYVENTAGLGEY